MSSRPPGAPPELPGYKFVRHLGSGGFADVFLYEQQLLGRRPVAVKVLVKGELVEGALDTFSNEATLMAALSNHPSIVSVFQADISADGRPFIVMEYCSKPTLHARYRAARFSEAETLKVGIQIAGAVETAHRAGILHRDIKPANILVTDYGFPALTDFGIAATTSSGAAAAVSVPWAPAEAFDSSRMGDERSDVYSLGATLYTLLAGRTPFEIPGASNTRVDLTGRIQTAPLPKIGRADVQPSVERALATALAREPDDRYPTAMAFARVLQRLQIERGMQATAVHLLDDTVEAEERVEDEGRTIVRSVVTIEAQRPSADPAPSPIGETAARTLRRDSGESPDETVLRGALGATVDPQAATGRTSETGATAGTLAPTTPDPDARPARRSRPVIVGVSVAVALAAGLGVAGWVLAPQAVAPRTPTLSAPPIDPGTSAGPVPKVVGPKGVVLASGKVRFTWTTNPAIRSGDGYQWRRVELGVEHTFAATTQPSVTVAAAASGKTCIEVKVRLSNGVRSADTAMGCVG